MVGWREASDLSVCDGHVELLAPVPESARGDGRTDRQWAVWSASAAYVGSNMPRVLPNDGYGVRSTILGR